MQKILRWARDHAPELHLYSGLAAVSVGVGLLCCPAGIIVAGVSAATLGVLMALGDKGGGSA